MYKFLNLLSDLQSSILSLKLDYQLFQMLKNQALQVNVNSQSLQHYVRSLIMVYELSNNEKLYNVKRLVISINQMAVRLKSLVCQMMSSVIIYFQKEKQTGSIPIEVLSQAIQIMILSARVCLNEGTEYISDIMEFYKYIHNPYEFVMDSLKRNFQFIHQLNVIQLMRYRCEAQSFNIIQFQKRLKLTFSYEEIQIVDYRQYIENIVLEIVLKSLKNGKLKPQNTENFLCYLSEQNRRDLQAMTSNSFDSTKNIQKTSQFLQIYLQIKQNGIQAINFQFLQEFIKNDKNFNDQRIFQIAALTGEPIILSIWFGLLHNKKEKSPNLDKALYCFIHISERLIEGSSSILSQNRIYDLLKLSKNVILILLTDKKSSGTNQPILNTIKIFVKLISCLCFKLSDNWAQLKDLGEKTVLLASRYQCMQICKVIYSIMLYYCLITDNSCTQIYDKFIDHHSSPQDKSSELYKMLFSAYEFKNYQNNNNSNELNSNINQIMKNQIKKQPFIAILFAAQSQDLIILDIDMSQFRQIQRKFQIYNQLLKKYHQNQKNLLKVLNHLQNFIIKVKAQQFRSYITSEENEAIKQLQINLIEILQQKNTTKRILTLNTEINSQIKEKNSSICVSESQICFILINLYIFTKKQLIQPLRTSNVGILLNKYSIKVKYVNYLTELLEKGIIQIQDQFFRILCCYILTVADKLKKQFIKKQRIGQAGQISFVHAIQDLVMTFIHVKQRKMNVQQLPDNRQSLEGQKIKQKIKNSKQKSQIELINRNYVYFTIFQTDCLTNNHEKYLKEVEEIPIDLLKTYAQSSFVPKNLKHKLIRRMVMENFLYQKCEISLKQFKQIIQTTQDQNEVSLYMKCVSSTFGEQGKNMLLLMAHKDKRIQKILLNESEMQI